MAMLPIIFIECFVFIIGPTNQGMIYTLEYQILKVIDGIMGFWGKYKDNASIPSLSFADVSNPSKDFQLLSLRFSISLWTEIVMYHIFSMPCTMEIFSLYLGKIFSFDEDGITECQFWDCCLLLEVTKGQDDVFSRKWDATLSHHITMPEWQKHL